MRLLTIVLAAFLITGCAGQDRRVLTEFEPLANDGFRYEAVADVAHLAAAPDAEQERIQWLETYPAENRLCPDRYEITERKPVSTGHAPLGPTHRIYYRGRCR